MGKINAIIMLEMLGRPKEHLVDTMKSLVEKLGSEKNIKVISKKISEPKDINENNLFSCFSEVEIEVESMMELIFVCFMYMPSHVEVITPEEVKVKNSDLNAALNELARKLHYYDGIAKKMLVDNSILRTKLEEVMKSAKSQGKQTKKVKKKKN